MTSYHRWWLVPVLLASAAQGWAQAKERTPHIGYLYPAGGRRGTVVYVTVGGQFLGSCDGVRVSGEGVKATVHLTSKPIDNKQGREFRRQLQEVVRRRRASGKGKDPEAAPMNADRPGVLEGEMLDIPLHPLLRGLEQMSLRELEAWMAQFLDPEKRQPNQQLADTVLLEVALDAEAAPGDREIRLSTAAGLTNPICFQVGTLPEVDEREPNDQEAAARLLVDLPALFNGRIMPGDVDRYRFRARRGQRIIVCAQARRLLPYLADAVPGWFQATLALHDAAGKEIAFVDDWRFDPDPVLAFAIPADGEYEWEIRDALYRGREDFVYRVSVSEQPFVLQSFPLGGREGVETQARIAGRNLPGESLALDTRPGAGSLRDTLVTAGTLVSNRVVYAVDTLPERMEVEPNDDRGNAQEVTLPLIVNGRVGAPGDVDVYRFAGKAGETVVAEVLARRLNSPLDSLLRLCDSAGQVVAWNDDLEQPEAGLATHHADSYLLVRLPADGAYTVAVADAERHGDESFSYRLRLSPPRPDFAVRVAPSCLNISPTGTIAFDVHVRRIDGFAGEIELALADSTAGFSLSGGRIPAGRDRMRMTLSARATVPEPVALRLEGRATIGAESVRREAVPAEDMMQAFLYRHLVPARELLVTTPRKGRRLPDVRVATPGPVRIPIGGTARVRVTVAAGRGKQPVPEFQFELDNPPTGLTLEGAVVGTDGLELVLAAKGADLKAGFADNLIVKIHREETGGGKDGKAGQEKRRVTVGVLPAIPVEVVAP